MMLMHVLVSLAWAMLPWINAPAMLSTSWWIHLLWPLLLQILMDLSNHPAVRLMSKNEQLSPAVIETIHKYASHVDYVVMEGLFVFENSFPQAASDILRIIAFLVCLAGLCFSKRTIKSTRKISTI